MLCSKSHEYVYEKSGNYYIGLTDYAIEQLGDIVFVELPEVGDEIVAEETFGSVESVKTVSELYAPISGKVIEVNTNLEDSPELVNESPYEGAWMIVIEPKDISELAKLMTAEQYEALLSKE